MDIKYIESILMLCEEKNISRAAEKLFLTQQGLSRRVLAVEKELGERLFIRTQNGVQPTAACRRIEPYFRNIYINTMMALNAAKTIEVRGQSKVTIAFAAGISNAMNTDFLMDFAMDFPETEMRLLEWTKDECVKRLLDGEAEIVFMVDPFERAHLNVYTLGEDAIYLAIHQNHALAKHPDPVPLCCLHGERIITGSGQNALRGLFDYFCQLEGVRPEIAVSLSYGLDVIHTMTENVGIATITGAMAHKITNPNLVIKKLLTLKPVYLYCCTAKDFPNKGPSSGLLEHIRRHFE